MRPQYVLDALPAILRFYDIRPRSSPTHRRCFRCRRSFGRKRNPNDPFEIACQSLAVQPCSHFIGTECFKDMLEHGEDRCQICNTRICVLAYLLPVWLEYMCTSRWFRDSVDAARAVASMYNKSAPIDVLFYVLSHGIATKDYALHLWMLHLVSIPPYSAVLLLLTVISYVDLAMNDIFGEYRVFKLTAFLLGYREGQSMVMRFAIDLAYGIAMRTCACLRADEPEGQRFRPLVLCSFYLPMRMILAHLSQKQLVLLVSLDWAAFAVVTRLLISYSLNRQM